MVPELGLILLICATVLSLSGMVMGCFANQATSLVVRNVYATLFLVVGAFAVLVWSFWSVDLTVATVYAQAHADLPWYYRLSAAWGGHEGSMLLWVLILALWSAYALNLTRGSMLYNKVAALLAMLFSGLISFIIFTSNPFARYLPMQPLEGQDLNPLLQDPLMVIHPPILYAGYVGFAIPFVIAMACLWQRSLGLEALQWIRKTALLAFAFLTLGITLGSFWAYYELGWGGWWFWDPVENASLMPWLSGLALIHVAGLSLRRQQYQNWLIFLTIISFALSMLGTFLVRSGVLTSVHSFASDPTRGFYILALFTAYLIPAFFLYGRRVGELTSTKPYILTSREGLMMINSGLFIAMAATVSLGTLYPLVLEALNLGFISVGAPYFNTVMIPLFFMGIVGMMVTPVAAWGKPIDKRRVGISYVLLKVVILLVCAVSAYFSSELKTVTVFAGVIALWVLGYALIGIIYDKAQWRLMRFWGMHCAHIGVVVFMLGVAISSQWGLSKDVRMKLHDTVQVGNYQFTLDKLSGVKGENFDAMQADMTVKSNGYSTVLTPQKRYYFARELFISQTAIDGSVTRDIYIALATPVQDAWDIRIYIKPFQRWIWAGGLMIMLGSVLSFFDRRSSRR